MVNTEIAQSKLLPKLLAGVGLGAVIGAAIAWQNPLLVLAGCVGIVLAAVILRSPFIGMLFVVFFLPFERVGAYESTIGTIRINQVIAVMVIGAWVFHVLWQKLKLRPNPLTIPLTIFLAVNVIGLTQAPNLSRGFAVLMLTSFTIFFGWVVPQIIRTREQITRVVWVLFFAAAMVGAFGIFQFVGDTIGLPTSITGLRDLYTKDVFGFPRIQSTALEPLYFANYLLLPVGLLYAFFLSKHSLLSPLITFLLLGLLGANVVLTVSRGGYLGLVVTILVVTAFRLRHFFRFRTLVPLALALILILGVVTQLLGAGDVAGVNIETFVSHIQNAFFGASFSERVTTIEQAQAAFWSSPWVGIGPGGFGPYAAAMRLVQPDGGWLIVNNESIELLAETGILGLLSMLGAIFVLCMRSIKALRRDGDPMMKLILTGTFAALLGVIAQYQTFSILYIMHVWFLIGFLVAVQNEILKPTNA